MSIKNIVSSQLPEITTYDSTGNITGIVVDTVTANTIATAGNLETSGNVVGANLLTSGQVIATGNVNGGNIVTPGQVVATGNITADNFLTSGTMFAAGNISAGNFETLGTANVGTLAVVSNATVGNNIVVSGNATAANYTTAGVVAATGNVSGGNLVTVGNVVATGNVIGGNIVSIGDVDIEGNVYANYVFATGNVVVDGNVDADIVNTSNVVGPTVTITSTNANADISINPNGFGNIVVNSSYINGVLNPVQSQDVATKDYVDSVAVGLQYKVASNVATTVGLPAYSYNNGTLGVGATITGNVNGVLTIDTVATTLGMRVLVKNETLADSPFNGIYDVTVPGDSGNVYVLTRSADNDTSADMNGAYTFIESGNVNGTTSWTCTATTANPVVIGTDPIEWIQFARPSTYQAGNGLSLNGTVFNVNVDNDTTAITGANVVVKVGANLVTPNIGNATGNSLTLTGTGNISGGNLAISGLATVGANLTSGNLTTGTIVANGDISGANLTLSGTMTANGTATAGNLVTGGDLLVTSNATIDGTASILTELYVGPTANAAIVTGPVIFAEGAANGFSQIGLQSTNGNSSADMIVYSNDGSDSDGFADMGVTGNTFNDTNYTVTAPNDGYIFVQGTSGSGGNLVIATGDVGNTHDIVFATGGFLAANEKLRLVDATSTLQPTANTGVDLGSNTKYFGNLYAGTTTIAGNITATGNIAGNYFIGNGALLTGITGGGGNATAINNGTSNVRIATANGDISMSVANVSNVVTVSSNTLRVNGNIFDATGQVYGVAASFARFKRTTQQTTGIGVNGVIICNVAEDTFGTDIVVNTGTGQITLLAGKSYRLMGAVPTFIGGTGSFLGVMWYNETTAAYIGSAADGYSPTAAAAFGAMGGQAEVIITPTVNTVVSFRVLTNTNVTGLGGNTDFNVAGSYPWIDIQVIGGQTPLTVGYTASSFAKYTRTTAQTGVAANTVVVCNVVEDVGGSEIVVDGTTGNITLAAGRSYRLRGGIGAFTNVGGRISYQWWNVTTAAWIGEAAVAFSPTSGTGTSNYQGSAECVLTPTVTTVVQLRVGQNNGTGTILPANAQSGTDGAGAPFIDVEVIGGQMPVTNTAQYGTATTTIADSTAITGQTYAASTAIMSWALPTAGTYQLNFNVASYIFGASIFYTWLGVNGALVTNSTMLQAGNNANGGSYPINGSFIYTATGPTTVVLNTFVNLNGSGGAVVYNSAQAGTRGTYEQIGGLLPATFGTGFNTITSITDGQTVTGNQALQDVQGGAFTIPSAGTWEISYSITATVSGGWWGAALADASNVVVPNSAVNYSSPGGGSYVTLSQTVIVTTTAAATYKLQWRSGSSGTTGTIQNSTAINKGTSVITYSQIGTLSTAVNSVVAASVAKFTRTTSQTGVVANTVVVCNVQESLIGSTIGVDTVTGNVTLQAGGTYRLRGSTGLFQAGTSRISYQWWNATTSSWIGEPATIDAPTSGSSWAKYPGTAECVITPSTTTVVQLRVGAVSTTGTINILPVTDIDGGQPFIDVEQIGGYTPSNSLTQYGIATNIAADNVAISSSSATPSSIMTFNIPAAGTWNITPTISWGTVASSSGFYALYRGATPLASNAVAATVNNMAGIGPGTGISGSASTTYTVVTTGPTTFTVGAYSTAGTVVTYNSGSGITRGVFTQIAGQIATAALPALSLAKFKRTTSQTGIVANSVVICNVAEATAGGDINVNTTTGSITLQPNNTYRLRGTIGDALRISPGGCSGTFQWFDVTSGSLIGTATYLVSPSSSSNEFYYGGTTEAIFTPTVATVVQLRVIDLDNINTIGNSTIADSFPWIDIEVIGTQAPSSGEPNWRDAGTLQAVGIGATTTAPTFPTFSTVTRNSVRYKQIGPKTYQLMMTLNVSGGTGGTAGSGDYLFTLPAGLQFDNSIYPAYTGQVQTSSYLPFSYQIPGASAYMNGNTNVVAAIGQSVIVPWNATQYRVWWTYGGTVQAYGSGFFQFGGYTSFDTNWQFTFQST
jgi:cytoskeletal protein CcmA (bactofilin family)